MSGWPGTRYKSPGRPPAVPVPQTPESWWAKHALETLEHRKFYDEARLLLPVLAASPFGKMTYKPVLGPDSYTTMQTNRWKRDEA